MKRIRIDSRALLGGLTAVGLAAAGMGSVPEANATCASFFGINNGNGCTSTLFSVAIGIGANTVANASGFLGAAYAIGDAAEATAGGPLDLAFAAGPASLARVSGSLSAAIATGTQTGAYQYAEAEAGYGASDFANISLALASDSYAFTGGLDPSQVGAGNFALNLGKGNDVEANGFLNSAIAVGGTKTYPNNVVYATGTLNNATSFFGDKNNVAGGTSLGSVLNLGFNVFGSNNSVTAGPGPFALAGALFTSGATVTKEKAGFNINGLKVPNTAAAVRGPGAAKPSAAVRPSAGAKPGATVKPSAAVAPRGAAKG